MLAKVSGVNGRSLDVGFLRLPIGQQSALEVLTAHREPFVLVVPSSHKLAKRKRVRRGEVSAENFVMYERAYAPGFHDLILGMLRDAGIVPSVSQTAAEVATLISLVDALMGVAILPVSAVKHSAASVVACGLVGDLPMSEIALVCDKRVRTPVVDNFRSFALTKKLGPFKERLGCRPGLTSVPNTYGQC
jgi:DNA-binding transcriptional LysR family regulator